MRFLGLTSSCVLTRLQAAPSPVSVRTWGGSVTGGALGFGSVSVAVFATWAYAGRWFYGHLGEAGAYIAWASLFIGGAGGLLGKLAIGPGTRWRFAGGFALAFLAYSVLWMAAWFAAPKMIGEIVGALVGTAAFGLVLCAMFASWTRWPSVLVGLAAGNLAGYLLGEALFIRYGGSYGKLMWGAAYGIGFGAGIGHAMHAVQADLRKRLAAAAESLRRH